MARQWRNSQAPHLNEANLNALEAELAEVLAKARAAAAAALQPFFSIANNAATAKTMDVDYFDMAVTGLSR